MRDKEARRIFTTTLPLAFLLELDRIAKETHRKKNDILIEALSAWLHEYKQARTDGMHEDES